MNNRKQKCIENFKNFFIITVSIIFFLPGISSAQDHQKLTPLLIDLSGWTAAAASVKTIQTGNTNMVTSTRIYQQSGEKNLQAILITGNTVAYSSGFASGKNINTSISRITTKTIDGFQVETRFKKTDRSGAVMVMIKGGQINGAIFILEFKGIPDNLALELVQRFDWSKMRANLI